ncbi:hypothetical protein RCZ04_16720 [Capnocytophaga sp. HP1101]
MDGNTNTLSEVIQQIVKQNHLTYGLQKASLPALWNELMGKAIAKYTSSVELKGNTLYVRLTSPALSNELSYGKTKIIANLNERLGEELIQKLIFLN